MLRTRLKEVKNRGKSEGKAVKDKAQGVSQQVKGVKNRTLKGRKLRTRLKGSVSELKAIKNRIW